MAVAIEVIRKRVCDLCGSDGDVRHIRIQLLGERTKTSTLDLCSEHSAPMVTAVETKMRTGNRRVRRITSPEQIPVKKTAAKRARKKA